MQDGSRQRAGIVVLKYFYDHAQHWVTPINVALGIYAKVPPYSVEAVQSSYFPDSMDTRKLKKKVLV